MYLRICQKKTENGTGLVKRTVSENKLRFQNMLYDYEYELKTDIIKNRGNTFHQLGFTNEEVENKIFKAPVLTAKESLNHGYKFILNACFRIFLTVF